MDFAMLDATQPEDFHFLTTAADSNFPEYICDGSWPEHSTQLDARSRAGLQLLPSYQDCVPHNFFGESPESWSAFTVTPEVAVTATGKELHSSTAPDTSLCRQPRTCKAIRKSDTDIALLATCFNMPINQASIKLGICPTLLKRICRKHGIERWPYRKLQSMERHIGKLEGALHEEAKAVRGYQSMNVAAQLIVMKEQHACLCFKPNQ